MHPSSGAGKRPSSFVVVYTRKIGPSSAVQLAPIRRWMIARARPDRVQPRTAPCSSSVAPYERAGTS